MFIALAAIAAVFALTACGGGGNDNSVVGVLWEWNGVQETQPSSLSAVPDPQNYLLTLNDDGTFNAKADCNNLSGTYTLSGNDLTLQPGPMTRAACPPDSLSDKYISLLHDVATYSLENEQLVLGLKNDAGSMFFNAG